MKIAKFLGNKQIDFVEVEEPQINNKTDIKIAIQYCGICGSDIGAYAYPPLDVPSTLRRSEPPYAQGHEFTGIIVEIGESVEKFRIGDRVTAEPLMFCGECDECKSGHYNVCEQITCLGYAADGAFAQYIVVDEKTVHLLPENIDFKVGTLIEPTGVGYGAVVDSGLKFQDSCVIFGAGTIGLMAMQTANIMGAKMTIVVDVSQERLSLAKEMGATYTINAKNEDTVSRIKELTGRGGDVIIEAAGSQQTFTNAISCAKKHGIIQVVAIFHEPIVIENQVAFMGNDLTLKMSSAAYNNRFDDILCLIAEGKLTPQKLISKEILLDNLVDEGIEALMNNKSLYKILVNCHE